MPAPVSTPSANQSGTRPQAQFRDQDGDGTYNPTSLSRKTGLITCLVIASVVVVMVLSGLIRASNRPDQFTRANNDLKAAIEKLPFTARLPQQPPAGARLVGVIVQIPEDDRGPSVYAVETTYTVIGDKQAENGSARYVRVWQTNDVYLRKRALDPLSEAPDPTDIAGQTWFRRTGESLERQAGVSYTTRYADGITMVVSGPDEQLVLDTIDTIAQAPAAA